MGQVLIKDLLRLKDFDPMNVDVSYIQETIALIPKDGQINVNQAEQLATLFLRCADYCSDLMSQAIRYLGYCDSQKKASKGTAIETKIANKTPATTARETYGNDPSYVDRSEKHAEAQAFLTFIQQKHNNLIKAHVLCKDLMKAHTQTRDQSAWDPGDEDFDQDEPSKSPPVKSQNVSQVKTDNDLDLDDNDFDFKI